MEENVVFKGTKNGLKMILDGECSFNELLEQINNKVGQAGRFFKGASINVQYRGRALSDDEKDKVREIMENVSGARILSMDKEEEDNPNDDVPAAKKEPETGMFKGIAEGYTKFYRGTVRSGQLLSYRGNIVVIGDVNPGAEVVAGGNVIVLGTLRGTVHAGSNGNNQAVVVAFNLQPTQLRIADVITRSPDEKPAKSFAPELAYVKDDKVYIESYTRS